VIILATGVVVGFVAIIVMELVWLLNAYDPDEILWAQLLLGLQKAKEGIGLSCLMRDYINCTALKQR